ncbi:MAG: xanthine dehydrogenase family protein subunit M [Woeseiaceae bacterium]|nr:xanthine dehydrogenase family protein subunit M [Woeseiaceae bacterium]
MNDFDFIQASDRQAALDLIQASPGSVPVAGGTNLLVNLKRRPLDTGLVVDVSRIESLKSIDDAGSAIKIGAGVTLAQILDWRPGGVIETLMQPMAAAFSGPLIRNLATVGGNVCDASPAADVSPPLLALDACVHLENAAGQSRTLALGDFFKGVRHTALQAGELLTSIEFDKPSAADRGFYYKLGKRKADAISIVSIAIRLRQESGKVTECRIALGAVAPVAMRAPAAEAELQGKSLTTARIASAAAAAAAESKPIDDFRASGAYRRRMVEVLVRRGLEQLATAC